MQKAPPQPDDVLASDFLGKSSPGDIGDPSKMTNDKERLDKMLAHISYSRRKEYIARGEIDWYVGRMAAEMLRQIDVFLSSIPDHMKAWFPDRTLLANARVSIEAWADESVTFTHTVSAAIVVGPIARPKVNPKLAYHTSGVICAP